MRKLNLVLFSMFVGMVVVSTASAVSFTAGLKYWYPEWELDGYSDFDTIKWDSTSGMYGPSLNLRTGEKFAISLSYFMGTFEKDMGTVRYNDKNSDAVWESDRTDADLACVILFNNYFKMFFGLKTITYDQTLDGTWTDGETWHLDYEMTTYGPGVGIGGSYPIGNTGFVLYGTASYSYLFGNFTIDGSHYSGADYDVDSYPVISTEFGSNYIFPSFPLILALSYRYQDSAIDLEAEADANGFGSWDETFYGIIAYVGWRFGGN